MIYGLYYLIGPYGMAWKMPYAECDLKTIPNKSAGRKRDIELNNRLETVGEMRFFLLMIATK